LKYESKIAYRDFVNKVETSLKHKPSNFWKYVNKNRFINNIPKNLKLGAITSSCEQDAASLFAKHFSSLYLNEKDRVLCNNLDMPTFDLPNNVFFSVDDVFQKLFALRSVWSVGPDGLSGEFLFQLRHIIEYSLWILFRRSLDEGVFPCMLKFSSITPVPKSESHTAISNYRPISILSNLSKILESLVFDFIQQPVNKLVMDEQHGYRPSRSTTTCNLIFTNFVYETLIKHLTL